MFTVKRHLAGQLYCFLGSVDFGLSTGKKWISEDSRNIFICAFRGPLNPTTFKPSSVFSDSYFTGRIATGEKDTVGDRSCYHQNYSGEVTLVGAKSRIQKIAGSNYQQAYGKWNGAYKWDNFGYTLDGDANEIQIRKTDKSYTDSPSNDDNEIDVTVRVVVSGDNALFAYYRTGRYFYSGKWYPITQSYVNYITFMRDRTYSVSSTVSSLKELFKLVPKTVPGARTSPAVVFQPDPMSSQETVRAFSTINSLLNLKGTFLPDMVPEQFRAFGKLAKRCADRARATDVNGLSFINELSRWRDLIPKAGPLNKLKTFANIYLCLRYGVFLTLQDTKALVSSVNNAIEQAAKLNLYDTYYADDTYTGRLGKYYYEDEYHLKLTCNKYSHPAMDLIRSLDDWGLYPNLERLWDMVPLSFVLDWFVNLSSLFENIDLQTRYDYLRIESVCSTRKIVVHLPVTSIQADFPGYGQLDQVRYSRSVGPQLLELPPVELNGISDFDNFVELGALIIGRKK